MSKSIEFAVLTKSRKNGGYCVAGIDWNTGKFVRLVSNDKTTNGAIKGDTFQDVTGRVIECLDLIKVELLGSNGVRCQPENQIVNLNNMVYIRKVSLREVLTKHPVDKVDNIFVGEYGSFPHSEIDKTDGSLLLVKADDFIIVEEGKSSQKYRAYFKCNGKCYFHFYVTDEKHENTNGIIDTMFANNLYLVISFGEICQEQHYKFVAAIYKDDLSSYKEDYEDMINPEGIVEGDGVNLITLVRSINNYLEKNNKKKITRKNLYDQLVAKGFLYKKNKKSRIDTKGFASGIFYKNAFTQKGEAYRGIFYNRNMQAMILDFIDILTDEEKKYILKNQ